jgi:lipopolysaccharide biosynthesis regulator YciM
MSHSPTTTQPPEANASSLLPQPRSADSVAAIDETVRRLRAELALATSPSRQARFLADIADLEETIGDQPGAARDYLAAYNADPAFHEPLEGLVRLLEKRRSLKNLGKLIDALVRAATGPDETARALTMRATFEADVNGHLGEAKSSARAATEVPGAPAAERATAWLLLEVLAGRTGDPATRQEALRERTKYASDPSWHTLLLVDCARLAESAGDIDVALSLLEEARLLDSDGTWAATVLLEQILRDHPGVAGTDEARIHSEKHATALESLAGLIQDSIVDAARGDAFGVPHWVRQPTRMVDAWMRAAEAHKRAAQFARAAGALDRALALVTNIEDDDSRLAEAFVANARIRVAEQTGDTALAAQLAEKRLATEQDGGLAAALAMRVAEHAATQGDATRALEALSRAISTDPGCLPARALQLDMLANGGDQGAFAAQLESFAEHLATDDARGRSFLLAAYVWAIRANDIAGAKAALSQAAMFGVAPSTTARLGRALASVAGDSAWYEEATKRLIAGGGAEDESPSLHLELLRLRHARGDIEGAASALRDMAGAPKAVWLANVLEAYLPPGGPASQPHSDDGLEAAKDRPRLAIEQLVSLENDGDLARGLAIVAATRAQSAGDTQAARARLRDLAARDPADALVASYLGDLDRRAEDHTAAARLASDAASSSTDHELAATLHLEAAFEHWQGGNRKTALEEMEAAIPGAPEAARTALGWASWAVDGDVLPARRISIERATRAGGDVASLALERFATELGAGDAVSAAAALAVVDELAEGPIGVAAALGRLAWSGAPSETEAIDRAIARIASCGLDAALVAAGEQARVARDSGDREEAARAANRWFHAGGGLPSALEWLAAAALLEDRREERQALLAIASALSAEGREEVLASAALLKAEIDPGEPVPLVLGSCPAVRLANLELAPPGCDPRRRAAALGDLDGALGEDAGADAASLSGWTWLAAGDSATARDAFERATTRRPSDLAAWEGLRACAENDGDRALLARAAAELGSRCNDQQRGAAFWEQAALVWLELGDETNADRALEASFARDAGRGVAFDKLFRRVRARKDNDHLLAIVARRLQVTDEPSEIQKLFWEQARVLREKGDQDGALTALEHVTMLDPDHVGALALLGEINIRRGLFAEAAVSLTRLATLETAPAKSRVTAGVAAVDLYEKKLEKPEAALAILLALHRAKLSSLPVRERLARAAARTGSWNEATSILEELMHERPELEGRVEAARLAMAIHRDRLRNRQGAAAAVVKLLEEEPADGDALDMLLETEHPSDVRQRLLQNARRALVKHLEARPYDLGPMRRLVKVANAQRDAALHQAGLGALLALGAGDAATEQAFAQLSSKKERTPQVAASVNTLRAILASGDDGPVADLFELLGPTLAEALGPTLQACGVGRRDKVDPRSGLALRNEIAAWAGAFGVREFDLYVGGPDPRLVQGIPGDPPVLVVGAGVNAPLTPLARGRIARELLEIVRGTTVTRSRDETSIAAIVVAACRLAEVPIEHPAYAVLPEIERQIGKAIARKTRKLLPDVCRSIASRNIDARAWHRRALASQDRMATIASGDPAVVLSDVLRVPLDRLGTAVKGSPRAEELLRFVLSESYLELRRSLGLEGSP